MTIHREPLPTRIRARRTMHIRQVTRLICARLGDLMCRYASRSRDQHPSGIVRPTTASMASDFGRPALITAWIRGSFDCESSFYEARRADGRQYLLAGADRLRVGAPQSDPGAAPRKWLDDRRTSVRNEGMDQLGLCLQLKEARRHVQYRAGSAKRIYTHASPSSSYVACDPRLSWSPRSMRL